MEAQTQTPTRNPREAPKIKETTVLEDCVAALKATMATIDQVHYPSLLKQVAAAVKRAEPKGQ
jgi:hypothetical protein